MIFGTVNLTYIYEIGSVVGIVILLICLYLIEKIIRLFPGGNIVRKWRIMQLLIILLISLFILDWAVWIEDNHDLLFIIGGILRIGTALLFGIILLLFYRTIQIVLKKSN